jgi:hypothetical protein
VGDGDKCFQNSGAPAANLVEFRTGLASVLHLPSAPSSRVSGRVSGTVFTWRPGVRQGNTTSTQCVRMVQESASLSRCHPGIGMVRANSVYVEGNIYKK